MNRCLRCGTRMSSGRDDFKTDLIGLPVVLKQVEIFACPKCGETEVSIPNLEGLHGALAHVLIEKKGRLAGREFKFLRKFLDLNAGDLAKLIGVTPETVSRWENEKEPIGPTADRFIRLYVVYIKSLKRTALDSKMENVIEKLSRISPENSRPMNVCLKARNKGWTQAVVCEI